MKDKKLKRILKEFKLAAAKLSTTESASRATNLETNEETEVHQIAHGAAIGIGTLIQALEHGDVLDHDDIVRGVIKMTLDWEREHPELMGEGGGGDE